MTYSGENEFLKQNTLHQKVDNYLHVHTTNQKDPVSEGRVLCSCEGAVK